MALERLTRRTLLQGTFSLVFAPWAARPASAQPKPLELTSFFVAGYSCHDGPTVEYLLKPDQPLRLVREPENSHDRRAVAVRTQDGAMLGYVPKWLNPIPSGMLDRGESLSASILELRRDGEPWKRVKVGIFVPTAGSGPYERTSQDRIKAGHDEDSGAVNAAQAEALARDALLKERASLTRLELVPEVAGPMYGFRYEPDDVWAFRVNPDIPHVGGSRHVVVTKHTGDVVLNGWVGE